MKNFIQGMYQKKHFARRLISVILAVIVMGFALSWLVLVNFGTDPCTSMNLAILTFPDKPACRSMSCRTYTE